MESNIEDMYLGDTQGSDGQHAFNCSYYVMDELRELENLIPDQVLMTMSNVQNQPLMKMNFDKSYHDMKEGLLAAKINVGAYQTYLDSLFSFDASLVSDIDFYANYRQQCCSTKEEYEKACGRTKLVEGLGSKIMEQVLEKAKPALASKTFTQMSPSQQTEWLHIGKKVFEWCCCLNTTPVV